MGSAGSRPSGSRVPSEDHWSVLSPHSPPPERHGFWAKGRRGTRKGDYCCKYNPDQVPGLLGFFDLHPNFIIGIDFTKSNEWKGTISFGASSLHRIGNSTNPYQEAIQMVSTTIGEFHEEENIPCFGFGDVTTGDKHIFSFYPDQRQCVGFDEVQMRYREIALYLQPAEPTSFAPIIEMAMKVVEESGGRYHVLLIFTDGQVPQQSTQKETMDAIVAASTYPLFIILIGVGDGPWDMMKEFAKKDQDQALHNIQFVSFTEIMSENKCIERKRTKFAEAALKEIRKHHGSTIRRDILGHPSGGAPNISPLPPPLGIEGPSPNVLLNASYIEHGAASNSSDDLTCSICCAKAIDVIFDCCGNQACSVCRSKLQLCPFCRREIGDGIRRYVHQHAPMLSQEVC
ncbi:PREDICTED: E3 ubiquitin-protein ligase RGLG1-like [Nelumbo nucifera]|uniref:E3 ubiquitin-protein ligase RGLG1-like n=1 Tax=Nelumbo nucifera TaxID=4432 RepID=A0A1U7Z4P7_NELNU|nr:PREDICTED: E3 ubiquitin-protein ligase RGLG1-like [Nelumbo nucifera]